MLLSDTHNWFLYFYMSVNSQIAGYADLHRKSNWYGFQSGSPLACASAPRSILDWLWVGLEGNRRFDAAG